MENVMEAKEAIYKRRAIRDYTDEPIDEATVRKLIEAAIQAPSGMNLQPWAFVVIQDRNVLERLSTTAQSLLKASPEFRLVPEPIRTAIREDRFNIFYNAGTLIVICAKPTGAKADWDCCFAGQNLMVAARSMGLGTCPVGFAWHALDLPEVRRELKIPEGYQPILPIIVGHPREFPDGEVREGPEILTWIGAVERPVSERN